MLGGLFKSAWQNPSDEKRHSAIEKMKSETPENQLIFEQLALQDPSKRVRTACIAKINRPSSLFKIYQEHEEESTKLAAKQAFCDQIREQGKFSEIEFETLINTHLTAKPLVAQFCPYPSLRKQLIDDFPQTLQAEIIAQVVYADTRLYIAEQLDQIEALEIARRLLKGKDKKAERLIRNKLDVHRQHQKLVNTVNKSAKEICQQMEFIATHPSWRVEFKTKYQQYLSKWDALSLQPSSDIAHQFAEYCSIASLKVDKQVQEENAQSSQLRIAEQLKQYANTLSALELTDLVNESLSINAVLTEAISVWQESNHTITAEASVSESFLEAQAALDSLSDLIKAASPLNTDPRTQDIRETEHQLQALRWPKNYSSLAVKFELQKLIKEYQKQQRDSQLLEKSKLDNLHKRINRLLGSSKRGNLKKARQELAATSKAAESFSGRERVILDERLETAKEIVAKMNDWQNFATEPKLIELCDSMEDLAASTLHPDKLSQKISKLQQNWKELAHCDSADKHWPRFKQAADLAYEPCARFFEQRRIIQSENLLKREPLVQQLQELADNTDWESSPNYKSIETSLRNISRKWREIKNVDPNLGKEQWQRFSAIRDIIYAKLDVIYDQNIELKTQIINQLEALNQTELGEDSLEKLKLFQNRWQLIGITRRKQDQQAWQKFKAAGDSLYENVKHIRDEKRAKEDQQLDAYRNLIKQINHLSKTASDLSDADPQFARLCDSYSQLPDLPKDLPSKLVDAIAKDYQVATEHFALARERIIQTTKDQEMENLRQKARLYTQLEAAIFYNKDDQIADLEAQIEQIKINDKNLEKRFSQRSLMVKNSDKSVANQNRRKWCIDLEILLDLESPDSDKALRAQLQLERLERRGMGQNNLSQNKRLRELELDWLCTPGADPELQQTLDTRFFNALETSHS